MNGLAAVVVSGVSAAVYRDTPGCCASHTAPYRREVVELGSVVNGLHGGTAYLVVPKIEHRGSPKR